MARELNFDGLVGPTHHYGGLAFGNIASVENEGELSNPRQAALQGLAKMRQLRELGVPQAVFPPHYRPELSLARRMGFRGSDEQVLRDLAGEMPVLLAACYSASSMWTANAATVSPSADSADHKVHLTPANLMRMIHRSIEAPTTARILRAIFHDAERFEHHEPLPSSGATGDEGAANHTRLAPEYGRRGVQLFVYGESATVPSQPRPKLFPARHTKESCQGIVRLHRLPFEQVVIAQQNPEVIDQGVFHNDVISVGNRDLFFYHEQAFLEPDEVLADLCRKYSTVTGGQLRLLPVTAEQVPVGLAVTTYLFNSQLVSLQDGKTVLVAPVECKENAQVQDYIASLVEGEAPIDAVHYVDLRQSMQGGGGPACLRLRVVLTDEEMARIAPGVVFTDDVEAQITAWVERHYRESLHARDLADPNLAEESRAALDELTRLLGIGSIYPFQLG